MSADGDALLLALRLNGNAKRPKKVPRETGYLFALEKR
jgi:hypothetical protein